MIQRIQTVFLLLTAVLMGITAFSPLFLLSGSDVSLAFYSLGIYSDSGANIAYPTWGVVSFAVLSAIAALINIFLYKKRKTQIKTGILTAVFIIIFYVAVAAYFNAYHTQYGFSISGSGVQYGIILPIVAFIFNVLAVLKIKKDEKLVKSLDRIR